MDTEYRIIEVEVFSEGLDEMYYQRNLDNIGEAYCSSLELLKRIVYSIKVVK